MRFYSTLLSIALLLFIPFSSTVAAKRVVKDKNIYRTSDILSSRGYHTVLPKNCVLYIPENLKNKIVTKKPSGEFILWQQFLKKNYNWLQKMEVTYKQALGETPISEDKITRIKRTGKVVIAVYKNRPISMLKPKSPPTAQTD